jgi:hypothetical protein
LLVNWRDISVKNLFILLLRVLVIRDYMNRLSTTQTKTKTAPIAI